MSAAKSRRDIHAEITNKLIKAIEASPGDPVLPWRRSGGPLWMPVNALTNKAYNGVNIISLWVEAEARQFSAPDLGHLQTMGRARRAGAQGREGLARRLL